MTELGRQRQGQGQPQQNSNSSQLGLMRFLLKHSCGAEGGKSMVPIQPSERSVRTVCWTAHQEEAHSERTPGEGFPFPFVLTRHEGSHPQCKLGTLIRQACWGFKVQTSQSYRGGAHVRIRKGRGGFLKENKDTVYLNPRGSSVTNVSQQVEL